MHRLIRVLVFAPDADSALDAAQEPRFSSDGYGLEMDDSTIEVI